MVARVMTIPAGSRKLQDLIDEVRSTLPTIYGALIGYRGLIVLESERGNEILAISFWADEEAYKVSEKSAADNARRFGQAAGTPVSVESYNVIGSDGVRYF
jgi:heme-degrading monooxygenase HmoA